MRTHLTKNEQKVVNAIHVLTEQGKLTNAANIMQESDLEKYTYKLLRRLLTNGILTLKDGEYYTNHEYKAVTEKFPLSRIVDSKVTDEELEKEAAKNICVRGLLRLRDPRQLSEYIDRNIVEARLKETVLILKMLEGMEYYNGDPMQLPPVNTDEFMLSLEKYMHPVGN